MALNQKQEEDKKNLTMRSKLDQLGELCSAATDTSEDGQH